MNRSVTSEIVTKQQFKCAHCQSQSPITGIANLRTVGHCDWMRCIYCDKLSRFGLAIVTEVAPITITQKMIYTSTGEMVVQVVPKPCNQIMMTCGHSKIAV
jgi:hypothetical protein